MRRFTLRPALWSTLLIGVGLSCLTACSSAEEVPLRNLDAFVGPDAFVGAGGAGGGAEDPDAAMDAGTGGSEPIPDAGDLAPDLPPGEGQVVVMVEEGEGGYVAWYRDNRLFARSFTPETFDDDMPADAGMADAGMADAGMADAEPADADTADADPTDAGLSDMGEPDADGTSALPGLGMARFVGGSAVPPDQLYGAHIRGRPWWVFLPSGTDGRIQAWDISDDPEFEDPVSLNIYADRVTHDDDTISYRMRVAIKDDDILVVGRSGVPAEDQNIGEIPVAWQVLDNGMDLTEAVVDDTGMTFPDMVSGGLTEYVFGWEEGHCVALGTGTVPDGTWICHGRPGATLLGDDDLVFFAGPVEDELRLWRATPGAVAIPEIAGEGREEVSILGQDGEATLLQTDGQRSLYQLGPSLSGQLVTVETTRSWVVSPSMEQMSRTRGVARSGETFLLSIWSADEVAMVLEPPISASPAVPPPTFMRPEGCDTELLPETCIDLDRDCNGELYNGLCCGTTEANVNYSGVVEGRMRGSDQSPPLPMAAVPGEDDPAQIMMLFEQADEGSVQNSDVLLVPHRVGGELRDEPRTSIPVTTFRGVRLPSQIAAGSDFVVGLAEAVDGGRTVLLWGLPDEGAGWTNTIDQAFCGDEQDPVAVAVSEQDEAYVFCPDNYYRMDAGSQREDATEYAYNSDEVEGLTGLHWIVIRELPTEGGGTKDVALAAYGEDNTLVRWQVEGDGTLVMDGEDPPAGLVMGTDGDRRLPIYLPVEAGGPIVRRGFRLLEIWVEGVGWITAAATSWPLQTAVSPVAPFALTLGTISDPEDVVVGEQRLGLYFHDLRPGADWVGRLVLGGDTQILRGVFSTFGPSPFKLDETNRPDYYLNRYDGELQGEVNGYELACEEE